MNHFIADAKSFVLLYERWKFYDAREKDQMQVDGFVVEGIFHVKLSPVNMHMSRKIDYEGRKCI